MESQFLLLRSCIAEVPRWADLPPELLAIIAAGLQNPIDITRLRSICRPWRFSISPPPNKLSPFFPLRFSLPSFNGNREQSQLIAGAVYLFRHSRDPSKAWMVSLHESQAGKLFPRHALTSEWIAGLSGNHLDLLEWSATQIDTSYSYNNFQCSNFCHGCRQITRTMKVVFLSKSDFNHDFEALRLCERGFGGRDLGLMYHCVNKEESRSKLVGGSRNLTIDDFVSFNGRIYAIDALFFVYVLDSKTLQLIQMEGRPTALHSWLGSIRKRLVVLDGDLHVVGEFHGEYSVDKVDCLMYKLVMDDFNVRRCKWERVEDLGDRVLFINRNSSFSVSAAHLPHPWKGNCIVVIREVCCGLCGCSSNEKEILVFDLGVEHTEKQCVSMSSLQGYSDLFTPPSSWMTNESKYAGLCIVCMHINFLHCKSFSDMECSDVYLNIPCQKGKSCQKNFECVMPKNGQAPNPYKNYPIEENIILRAPSVVKTPLIYKDIVVEPDFDLVMKSWHETTLPYWQPNV